MVEHRERLQELLRELFQFDSAELDFGIYRIMNQKRAEIEAFIQKELLAGVADAFGVFTANASQNAQAELEGLARKVREAYGDGAIAATGVIAAPFQQLPLALQYASKQAEARQVRVSSEQEAQVYNDLYTFFARYYADGDFVMQPRYGAPRYHLPYNGEEVLFHWANRDQYYVKTTENFRDYAFRVQPGGFSVHFRLAAAQTEQNNNKGENRYFVPRGTEPVAFDAASNVCTLFFEYRPLTSAEKEAYGKSKVQDAINAAAAPSLARAVPQATLKGLLTALQGDSEKTLLEQHLMKYTRRNTSDYFIHKDLRGFLERELDFFIKNEVFLLDDLGGELEADAEPVRRLTARAKVVRQIGRRIIAFLAQIEEFQKRLFEKKKFVVQTDWCITLDRIPEAFHAEIVKNAAQWAEWERLFKVQKPKGNGKAALNFLAEHPSLVLDTQFFDADFKDRLLAIFEDLDVQTDGVLLHSENYQALSLLSQRYHGQVPCVYIDPPYNTGDSEILYKNGYLSASWLSLMQNRLALASQLLSKNSVSFIAIDDFEMAPLCELIDSHFPFLKRDMIVVNHHPQGGKAKTLANTHEYMLVCVDGEAIRTLTGRLGTDKVEQRPFKRSGTAESNFRIHRKNSFYAILVDPHSMNVVGIEPPPELNSKYPKSNTKNGQVRIYPLGAEGEERVWRRSFVSCGELIEKKKLMCSENMTIYQLVSAEERTPALFSNWVGPRYNAGTYGANLLRDIMGEQNPFSYPKSIYTVEDALFSVELEDEDICLDFFAGSGTTAHAVINLNREDDGNRKYILVEMGEYFDTVTKPRVQKVIYASDWKDGSPVEGAAGSSQMFKYQRLESYEDSLNNIAFDPALSPQPELLPQFPDYVLRYMLDHETRDNPVRLSVDKLSRPFDYRLLVARNGETREEPVDLVETFNYLLGLTVRRRLVYRHQSRPYRVVWGDLGGKRIAIIWRDTTDLDLQQDTAFVVDTVLKDAPADRIYVNGDSYVPGAESLDPIFKERMAG